MKKMIISLLLVCSSVLYAETIKIGDGTEENSVKITKNVTGYSVDISIAKIKHRMRNGYDDIGVDGCNKLKIEGAPALPVVTITSEEGELIIDEIEFDTVSLENMNIVPAIPPQKIGPKAIEQKQDLSIKPNPEIYNSPNVYPTSILQKIRTYTFKGKKRVVYGIYPIHFSPLQKKLIVYKKLTLNLVSKDPAVKVCAIATDEPGKVLIVTTTDFKEAAEKLQAWHTLKGYESTIETKSKWEIDDVKTTIRGSYDGNRNCYAVIIGDNEQVPAEEKNEDGYDYLIDLYYACVDGDDDYVPDIAMGRISVSTKDEAMSVVEKVINYEKNPPTKKSYYKNIVACSQYSDGDDGGAPDGYADRRFAESVEEVRDYMTDREYNVTRVYKAYDDVTPKNWNNDTWSWGKSLPDYLLKPAFAWDGSTDDITDAINEGAFLAYHYDHGWADGTGWVTPRFETSDVSSLKNKDMSTVILSINCSSGKYNEDVCFAEKLLRAKDAGTAGIIAPSNITYSGQNEGLMEGIIDGRWSGLTPRFPDVTPQVTPQDTLYCLGDLLTHGLLRMEETWVSYVGYSIYHYEIYHLFGDPTTRIWAKEPIEQSPTYNKGVNIDSTHFRMENVAGNMTYVSLLSKDGARLLATQKVKNASCAIALTEELKKEESVIVSIVGADCKPFYDTLIVSDENGPVAVNETYETDGNFVRVAPNPCVDENTFIMYSVKNSGIVSFAMYAINGSKITSKDMEVSSSDLVGKFKWSSVNEISKGTYIIKMSVNREEVSAFVFTKR